MVAVTRNTTRTTCTARSRHVVVLFQRFRIRNIVLGPVHLHVLITASLFGLVLLCNTVDAFSSPNYCRGCLSVHSHVHSHVRLQYDRTETSFSNYQHQHQLQQQQRRNSVCHITRTHALTTTTTSLKAENTQTQTEAQHKQKPSMTDEDFRSSRSQYWLEDNLPQQANVIRLGQALLDLQHQEEEEHEQDDDHGDDDDDDDDDDDATISKGNVPPSSSTTTTTTSSVVKDIHYNNKGQVIAVEISSAITAQDAVSIQNMAQLLQKSTTTTTTSTENSFQHLFQHRSFGENKGGNDCTYLAPLLQIIQPDITSKILAIANMAWSQANLGGQGEESGGEEVTTIDDDLSSINTYPNPKQLGIRTSEHLNYNGWTSLEGHKDNGSIYTIVIALTNPHIDYEGGSFFFHTSFFEQYEIRPEYCSAIVFLSDTIHGVRPMITASSGNNSCPTNGSTGTNNGRQTCVTELWNHNDSPLGMNRPTPEEWDTYLTTIK